MEVTIQQVEQIVSVLTDDEKQLLKDTINEGGWGDADMEFLDEGGNVQVDIQETVPGLQQSGGQIHIPLQ